MPIPSAISPADQSATNSTQSGILFATSESIVISSLGTSLLVSLHPNERKINNGYVNVTLRLLYSLGLLECEDKNNELNNVYTINSKFIKLMKIAL